MKVGLYIGADGPESGGGHAFVRAVLEGLDALTTRHSFQILHSGFGATERIGKMPVQRIADPPPPSIARKILNRIQGDAQAKTRRDQAIGAQVGALGLEIIWFLTPATLPTTLPYVMTVWDLAHRVEPEFPEVRTTGWTWDARETHYRRWLPPAAYVITGATALSEDVARCYGVSPRRIRVLSLVAPARNNVANAAPAGSERPYLFYPAQFWPHKNHVGLLLALKEVRERHGIDVSLVMCGADKGNLAHVRETATSLGLQSSVRFAGFVSDAELTALYRGATALVFPSFFGPDNLPPLEAMQLDCPVIAANAPGVSEQLGDAALLVDPRDATDIAAAIVRLFREPQLRDTLVTRGRERSRRWGPRQYASGMIEILDEFETERRCWGTTTEYVHT